MSKSLPSNNDNCLNVRDMQPFPIEYSLVNELKKCVFLNKKTFNNMECLKLRSIIKKDLDITLQDISEERKMKVLNSFDLSNFGKCFNNKCN